MYAIWNIKASDIAAELNRCGTYEERKIISAAEKLGYTCIEENGDMLEAIDLTVYCFRHCTCLERFARRA